MSDDVASCPYPALFLRKREVLDARLGRGLIAWFDANARDLPWRRKRNAYTALVAEFMLQQTQVARVVVAFEQFVARFPDVQTLADADQEDVLAMWRGLGYYRRALNLHAAARMIVTDFRGKVPSSAEGLRMLPGVGRYTAGAIASIVFNEREPIVDGNVRRVLARVLANDGGGDGWAWEAAARLVASARKPGVFNEGLMELGATVCLPRGPKCDGCPLRELCAARRQGEVERYPRIGTRVKPRAAVHHAVVIARRSSRIGAKIMMERRGAKGMWANMWQTPTIESTRALRAIEIKSALPVLINQLSLVGGFTHQTTHRTIEFKVYRAVSSARKAEWRTIDDVERLPMSNAQRRVLRMVIEKMNARH